MDYEEVLRIDAAAVDALGGPLRGTEKAFVITSGTAVVDPDPVVVRPRRIHLSRKPSF